MLGKILKTIPCTRTKSFWRYRTRLDDLTQMYENPILGKTRPSEVYRRNLSDLNVGLCFKRKPSKKWVSIVKHSVTCISAILCDLPNTYSFYFNIPMNKTFFLSVNKKPLQNWLLSKIYSRVKLSTSFPAKFRNNLCSDSCKVVL